MPIWYVGVAIGNAPRVVFDWMEEAVQRLHAQQQIALARFSVPRGRAKRHMFLRVDAGTRAEAQEYLDAACRLARFYADSEGTTLRFDGHLLAVNPNSIPLPVEPDIWHFTRGVYVQAEQQNTWRVPAALPRQQEDACDPLGPPEEDAPAPPPQKIDPASLLQTPPSLFGQQDASSLERHQRLLLWLSAAGQGSWEKFVGVSNQLGVSGDRVAARRVMRRLILLGHVESSPDGRAWSATPAALVQLTDDPTRAFWCGQRSESLRRRLEQARPVTTDAQAENDGPPRWLVNVGAVRDPGILLKARGLPIRWEGNAAENMARQVPDLDHWQDSLFRVAQLPTPEHAQRWEAGVYQNESTFQSVEGRPQGPTGLYRLIYGHERSSFELTGFVDGERGEFLRGDWYGLRFLAARRMGVRCVARWLQQGGRSLLLLPQSCRWPLLYERALVLASGLLPIHDGSRLCYFDVPHDLAATLARLLGVTLI